MAKMVCATCRTCTWRHAGVVSVLNGKYAAFCAQLAQGGQQRTRALVPAAANVRTADAMIEASPASAGQLATLATRASATAQASSMPTRKVRKVCSKANTDDTPSAQRAVKPRVKGRDRRTDSQIRAVLAEQPAPQPARRSIESFCPAVCDLIESAHFRQRWQEVEMLMPRPMRRACRTAHITPLRALEAAKRAVHSSVRTLRSGLAPASHVCACCLLQHAAATARTVQQQAGTAAAAAASVGNTDQAHPPAAGFELAEAAAEPLAPCGALAAIAAMRSQPHLTREHAVLSASAPPPVCGTDVATSLTSSDRRPAHSDRLQLEASGACSYKTAAESQDATASMIQSVWQTLTHRADYCRAQSYLEKHSCSTASGQSLVGAAFGNPDVEEHVCSFAALAACVLAMGTATSLELWRVPAGIADAEVQANAGLPDALARRKCVDELHHFFATAEEDSSKALM